jgi:hypothetical protein
MKVRRMTLRFRNLSLPRGKMGYHYTVEGLKSKNFRDIEKVWKIYLPFNKSDLEDYA